MNCNILKPEHQNIYDAVSNIPIGSVATYGQIAKIIGMPGHARQVGRALSRLPKESSVPWHRVVNASGKISERGYAEAGEFQRLLLEEEGITFSQSACISLPKYQWRPGEK